MDNDKKSTKSGAGILLLISGGLIAAFLLYYAVMSVLSPLSKLKEIREEYGSNEQSKESVPGIKSDSMYVNLLREKSFLQSRIAMAETDSIYLTLDLPDSIARLEISGVTVHASKISRMRTSKILRTGDETLIYSMLSTPLSIVKAFATIKKEPLMIKMAPKDTSEYKPDIIPDTSDVEPVNYLLEMNNGIRIYVYQSGDTSSVSKNNRFMFDMNDRIRNFFSSLKSVMLFKVPEYHPFIKIELPKADAKIMYRAIPRKGQIALYL
jgi:hypothetical protein